VCESRSSVFLFNSSNFFGRNNPFLRSSTSYVEDILFNATRWNCSLLLYVTLREMICPSCNFHLTDPLRRSLADCHASHSSLQAARGFWAGHVHLHLATCITMLYFSKSLSRYRYVRSPPKSSRMDSGSRRRPAACRKMGRVVVRRLGSRRRPAACLLKKKEMTAFVAGAT